MHIATATKTFLIQLQADGRSVHTINQYRRHLKSFIHWMAEDGLCGDLLKTDHEVVARSSRRHGPLDGLTARRPQLTA